MSDSILDILFSVDSTRHDSNNNLFYGGNIVTNWWDAFEGPASPNQSISFHNGYLSALNNPAQNFNGILWEETRLIMHKIHHCLGLGHLNEEAGRQYERGRGGCNGPDYLADAYPDGCPMPGRDRTINLMFLEHISTYISPLQIGRSQRSTYLGQISKYVYPTEALEEHPWVIDTSQTWDFPIRMFQNIIVDSGPTLTIKCLVQMPKNGKIIVKRDAKLVVDGGYISSYNSKRTWGGIEVEGQNGRPSNSNF